MLEILMIQTDLASGMEPMATEPEGITTKFRYRATGEN
jgi:hypothetical protein